jgi:DNA-binding XRE family transcriptional regulator
MPKSNGRTTKLIIEAKEWASSKMTQVKLAKAIDVSPQTISKWFKGKKFPSAEHALHLQELMGKKNKT